MHYRVADVVLACLAAGLPLIHHEKTMAASIQGLGPLPGIRQYAHAISADGSTIVGQLDDPVAGTREAFRWTLASGFQRLGQINPAQPDGRAMAVSADGSVVVGDSSNQAFVWRASTGMVRLDDVPGGLEACGANAVSADGSRVAGNVNTAAGGRAAYWENGPAPVVLDTPVASGRFPGGTNAMSADGRVLAGIAYGTSESPWPETFLWTQEAGSIGLGEFGPMHANSARAISADGLVVTGNADSPPHSVFRWTQQTGMADIGLPPGGTEAEANAISRDGSVIVGKAQPLGAFIWDAQHGSRWLRDALSNDYGLNLSGWYLPEATAITPDGKTIIGWGGYENGGMQTWVVHVPEPATLSLLALGGLLLRRRRT